MRQFHDLQDKEQLQKEATAIADMNFSRQEVEEFRDLYIHHDDDLSGSLCFDEVRQMICKVVALGAKRTQDLRMHFNAVLENDYTGTTGRIHDEIDFPEFL